MTIQTDTTYIAPAKRKAPATGAKYPAWVRVLIWTVLPLAVWAAIYFFVTAALSLGSGS